MTEQTTPQLEPSADANSQTAKPVPKVFFLMANDCPPCEMVRKAAESLGDKVAFLDLNSEEARSLLPEGTDKVELPTAIVGGKVCAIYSDGEVIGLDCGSGIVDLEDVLKQHEEQATEEAPIPLEAPSTPATMS